MNLALAPRARRDLLRRALALALAALVLGSGTAHAQRGDRDTTIERISIGSDGIRIERRDGAKRIERDATVRIDRTGVTVEEADAETTRSKRVSVHGPVVIVDDGDAGLVRVFADAEVDENERIEGDVVAVFGSVVVRGHVAGNVAAIFGSAVLEPGATVEGDVVALGGVLDQASGAVVNGESVSLGLFAWAPSVPTLPMMVGVVFGGWVVSLIGGLLLWLLFPSRMQRIAVTSAQRTGGSFVLGVASAPLVVISIVLLLVTVIGIPLAILLPLLYVTAVWAGQLAATYVLGCRLLRRPLETAGGSFGPLVAGTLFVASFFVIGAALAGPEGVLRTLALFFALLGILLQIGLSVVGIGAVLLSRFGTRPRLDAAEAASPGPLPGTSAPLPAPPSVG